jgi:energy-coupling factor transporter ATP-binding protein EcfA2
MLKSFKVESFKSLENVEVELGRVNVFIGANGSGKSNLLEALGVLGAAANGRVDDEALLRRGVRPGYPYLYKSNFKNTKPAADITFSAANEGASFTVGLLNSTEKPAPAWQFQLERLEESGKEPIDRNLVAQKFQFDPAAGYIALKAIELPQVSFAGRLLAELRQYAIYSPNTPTLRGLDTDPQSREPVGLNGGRLAEALCDLDEWNLALHVASR